MKQTKYGQDVLIVIYCVSVFLFLARYWHREDNGCSWLLQMNEKAQSLVFFLIQPVDGMFPFPIVYFLYLFIYLGLHEWFCQSIEGSFSSLCFCELMFLSD